MAKVTVSLPKSLLNCTRLRAHDLGLSLAAYVRLLIDRDHRDSQSKPDPSLVFDLGTSLGSNIAKNRDTLIAQAFAAQ